MFWKVFLNVQLLVASIVRELACTTACYVKHLEPNNIDYTLKFT